MRLADRSRRGRHSGDGFLTRIAGRLFAYGPRVPAISVLIRRRRRLLVDCSARPYTRPGTKIILLQWKYHIIIIVITPALITDIIINLIAGASTAANVFLSNISDRQVPNLRLALPTCVLWDIVHVPSTQYNIID